jgi:acyl carrier protein
VAVEPSPRDALRLDAAARRAWLVRTLSNLAPDFAGEITGDTPLADGGLGLDSLGLIDVVAALEEGLGVTVGEREITDEHFGSVARVLRLIEARVSPTAS